MFGPGTWIALSPLFTASLKRSAKALNLREGGEEGGEEGGGEGGRRRGRKEERRKEERKMS